MTITTSAEGRLVKGYWVGWLLRPDETAFEGSMCHLARVFAAHGHPQLIAIYEFDSGPPCLAIIEVDAERPEKRGIEG